MGRRLGDRRLPDLLPGHDQHAARAPVGRPARPRADALIRGEPLEDPPKASDPRLVPVPVHGAEDRGSGLRRRRDHRRAALVDPGRTRRGDPQLQPVLLTSPESLWATNIIAAGLGIIFFSVVAIAERLLVRRAPDTSREHGRRRRLGHRALEALRARRRARARPDRPGRAAGRVRLPDRPVRLRQVDAAADHRRPDPAERGRGARQRQERTPRAARPRLRHRLPGRRPLRLAHGGEEHRAAAGDGRLGPGTARGTRAGDARARRADRLREAPSLAAVRRDAAAGLDRAGALLLTAAPPDGRALRRADEIRGSG